jgi:predicted enzyme related to lactoylglutathione lyase
LDLDVAAVRLPDGIAGQSDDFWAIVRSQVLLRRSGGTVPNINILFAGVPVADFAGAVAWYTRLLGRPADVVAAENEVMWRFADAAWLYVVEDIRRAGHSLVALHVADLDEVVREIASRGITGKPIEIVGTAGRKASFTDADGNELSFIEVSAEQG